MSTRRMYREGLENHLDLIEELRAIEIIGKELNKQPNRVQTEVAGNEDLVEGLKNGMSNLGSGLFQVSKWVGGQAITLFSKGLSAAGNGLVRAFSDNDTLIRKLLQDISREQEQEVTVAAAKVALLTCEGDFDKLSGDMNTLIRALEQLDKHSKDVLSFLDKQLLVARKLKSASTADQILKITEEFDGLKYPVFGLSHSSGNKHASDVLPGGKVWEFVTAENGAPKYLMNGDAPEGAGASITMSKSEVSAVLNNLNKVNAMHKRLKQSYDSYLSFLKSWAEMVKSVDANLAKLDKVSGTAMSEAEKLLAGEPNALAFYSGFTPRVVSYTDRYIHGVLGVFA